MPKRYVDIDRLLETEEQVVADDDGNQKILSIKPQCEETEQPELDPEEDCIPKPEKKTNLVFEYLRGLKRATPSWADLDKIKQFYKNCPKGKVVTHMFPINGQSVSGLHVLGNLYYTRPDSIKYKKIK